MKEKWKKSADEGKKNGQFLFQKKKGRNSQQIYKLISIVIIFFCSLLISFTVPLFHTESVVGDNAKLPCNLTSPIVGDRVSLVIWYKEGQSTPIYSFDVRHTEHLDKGSHHEAGSGSLNGRSHFNTTLSSFIITNVKAQDHGLYRCRVDFIKSPTRNIKIQLSVIGESLLYFI
jgi:hypothetical protein